jgi:hypothetical protein
MNWPVNGFMVLLNIHVRIESKIIGKEVGAFAVWRPIPCLEHNGKM